MLFGTFVLQGEIILKMKQHQAKNSRRINNATSVVKWKKTVYKRENVEV